MFTKTANEVIRSALTKSGIIGVEQPIQAIDMHTGVETLNYLLQGWMAHGIRLWTEEDAVLFLEQGKRRYKLGSTNGVKSCYLDDLTNTAVTADALAAATTLQVTSTAGLTGVSNSLTVDPSITVTGWTVVNTGSISLVGGFLEVANGANDFGGARYELQTEVGKQYRIDYSYLSGTSSSADFSILDTQENVIATANQTVSGDYSLTFTATDPTSIFEIKNGTNVITETSQLDKLEQIQLDSGDYVSVRLDNGSRFWTTIVEVTDTNNFTFLDALPDSVTTGALIYSYPQSAQLQRPLNIDDIRYQSNINQAEIPVTKKTRNEDRMQPTKTSQGLVTWAYYSPQLNTGELDVWQLPSNNDAILQFTTIDPVVVTVENVEVVEIPAFYLNAVVWNLANEFITEYNIQGERAARIQQKAVIELEKALDYDEEKTDLFVSPGYA